MTPFAGRARSRFRKVIQWIQELLYSVVTAIVLFRLGNMQLDGLLSFGGIVLGLLFGFTSLMYNRARAYQSGSTQRRSLIAAELALRATLVYTIGASITTTLYYFLAHSGYKPTAEDKWPTQWAPALWAFFPLSFFAYVFFTLARATRLLVHGMLVPLTPRRLPKG